MMDRYENWNRRGMTVEPISGRLEAWHLASLVTRSHSYLRGPEGAETTSYLASRGVGQEAVAAFMIGLGPPNAHAMYRSSVVLPTLSVDGARTRLAGVSRRSDGGGPRYMHNGGFRKSEHLYGLEQAMPTMLDRSRAVIVEGFFDVLSMHSAGFAEAISPYGHSLSPRQASLLSSVRTVVVMMDGDDAGQRGQEAVGRTLAEACLAGTRVLFCSLPTGLDPNDFLLKEGADAMGDLIGEARG